MFNPKMHMPLIPVGAVCVAYLFKSRIEFKEKTRKEMCVCENFI